MTISTIDDTHYEIFAPNSTALDEAKEKIEELLSEEVNHAQIFTTLCLLHG